MGSSLSTGMCLTWVEVFFLYPLSWQNNSTHGSFGDLKSLSFSFRNCSEEKFSLHSNLPLENQKTLSVLIQNSQQKHQKVTVQAINGWGLWDRRVTSMLKQQAEKPGTKVKGKDAPGFQSFEGGCSPQQVSVLWIFCKSLTREEKNKWNIKSWTMVSSYDLNQACSVWGEVFIIKINSIWLQQWFFLGSVLHWECLALRSINYYNYYFLVCFEFHFRFFLMRFFFLLHPAFKPSSHDCLEKVCALNRLHKVIELCSLWDFRQWIQRCTEFNLRKTEFW